MCFILVPTVLVKVTEEGETDTEDVIFQLTTVKTAIHITRPTAAVFSNVLKFSNKRSTHCGVRCLNVVQLEATN